MFLFLLTESCNSRPVSSDQADGDSAAVQDSLPGDSTRAKDFVANSLPKDFNDFYLRFHEDSAYQMAHINWPLEGLPNAKSPEDTIPPEYFFWQKATWKKHNHFTDPGNNFQQWFEMKGDRIVEHWVLMKGTNMYIVRRFAKLDNGWHLIFYQGLRPTKR